MSTSSKPRGLSTLSVHAGQAPDARTGAVMTPIFATSTFAQSSPGVHTGWEYARSGNPTRAALEACVAELEGGARGFAFASGLAAENAVLDLLDAGSHIVAGSDVYGGTWRLFTRVRERTSGLSVTYVDPTAIAAIEAALRPETRMIWVESPGNPLLSLADLEAVGRLGKARGILTVADNTFASPALQRPIPLGIDIVVHSATKYLNGHSDVVAGIAVTADGDVGDRLAFLQNATGGVLDPFQSFLVLRGIKTLPLRMERHSRNGLAVARWLEAHPRVAKVIYPGLPSHPQHDLAKRQMTGFGGMISAYLDTDLAGTTRALERLRLFTLAESLGGVESLMGHPWTMSHASLPEDKRRALGVTSSLIRLSVGVEDEADLIGDLQQALDISK